MKINIKTLIKATLGEVYNTPSTLEISGIEIDSRKVHKDLCFFPVLGENFDGHDFIEKAFQAGACVSLCEKSYFYSHFNRLKSYSLILVDNTTEALGRLGQYILKLYNPKVIGITGSVGKTSTKEFVYQVLSQKYSVHKNKGNFNNHIGLPLTLLNLQEEHDFVILEMGMNHMKEIEKLANIARPDIALITNIGSSHIGNLGSKEKIYQAKLEIASYLTKSSTLILNGEDSYLNQVFSNAFEVLKVGTDHLKPYDIKIQENGCYGFRVDLNEKSYDIKLNVLGKHNIYNSLLGFMVGLKLDMPVKEIIKGLESLKENKGRLDIIKLDGLVEIISDCYNASEESMKSALEVLCNRPSYYKIAVLGDVLELGDFSEESHRRIGSFVATQIDELITYGHQSEFISKEAVNRGYLKNKTKHFESQEQLIKYVKLKFKHQPSILVKGSFGMDMIKIVKGLIKE